MPRKYNMARRRQQSEEQRRRIVEATFELHSEKGILATSIQDIAERADVSPNTVYRYFPTYNDAVRACGNHAFEMIPPPDEEPLLAEQELAQRVGSFVDRWFAFYAAAERGIEIARRAIVMPAVSQQLDDLETRRSRQIAMALGEGNEQARALLTALTTVDSWRSFKDAGLATRDAVRIVVRAVTELEANNRDGIPAGPAGLEGQAERNKTWPPFTK